METTRIGYKLFRVKRDGSLGSLFINRSQNIPVGKWLRAESHPTSGFAVRHGWHAVTKPVAPHLKKDRKDEKRVWAKVELRGVHEFERPEAQGGKWLLAKQLRVLEVIG